MAPLLADAPPMFRGARLDEEATPSCAARRLYEGAYRTGRTLTPIVESSQSGSPLTTTPTSTDDASSDLRRRAPAVAAVEDIHRWLSLPYNEVASLAGLAPSVIYHWKKMESSGRPMRPRAASVVRLFRMHSVLRSISIALGSEDDAGAVSTWANSRDGHQETPLDLLRAGRFEEANRRAAPVVFNRTPRPRTGRVFNPDPDIHAPPPRRPMPTDLGFEGLDIEGDEFE
jgi:hypothetical protein